jgi:HK97 family phage major capsid protein
MKDSTAGMIRMLRDGSGGTEGSPIWQPSTYIMAGQPDMLLGHPVWSDPNVAAQGSNARIVAFADFSAYDARTAYQVQIELDRSRWSDTDQTGVRVKLRADGVLIDTNGLVSLLMNV